MAHRVIIVVLLVSFFSCQKKSKPHELFEGPQVTIRGIDMLMSDSTIVKLRLKAKTQLELANGNREFPDGILLQFYDELGRLSSTLTAKFGYYYAKGDYYKAEGNVVMTNLSSGDELSTEVLLWTPADEKVHTDNFVTIKAEDEVLTGEGLEASQNFEEYTILKPSGTMSIQSAKPGIASPKPYSDD